MQRSRFRLLNACYNTMDGLKAVWREEQAFRQEVFLFVILTTVIFLAAFAVSVK